MTDRTQAPPEEVEAKTAEQRRDEAHSARQMAILEEARDAIHDDVAGASAAHERMRENIKFVAGDTWDAEARAQRVAERRPVMSFSKLNQYIDRVYGAMVQRRPSVTVRADDVPARGARANTESKRRIKGAAMRAGMIRQIEEENGALLTYLDAYESALGCGMGHWRLRIDYVGHAFDQVVLIDPIMDPMSVLWDHASTRITNEDARRCAISAAIPRSLFEQDHPGARTASMDAAGQIEHIEDWIEGDAVVVAEWYVKRPQEQVIAELSDGRVVRWQADTAAIREELAAMGVTVTRHRPHKGHVVEWYKLAGLDVLEGPVVIPGDYIPVVTAYGRRLWVDGKIVYRSLIEHAKDEQRAYDYTRTRAIEKAALAPLSPFVVGKSQIKGFEGKWKEANTKSHAYLPYDDSVNPNPPKREFGATDLGGLDQLIAMAETGMMSATGQYEASRGQRSNETSGRAVLARAQQADQITAPFEENFHAALTQSARIVNDWLPIVYQSGRIAKLLNEDGTDDAVILGRQEVVDEQTGKTVVLNDLAVGRYSVKVDTAPAFTTRRQEAVQGLTEFGKAFPGAGAVIAPDVLANSDFPGAERMARRVEATLPPEIRAAADEDDEDNPLPPQARAVVQKAEQAMQQAQEMVEKVRAEAEAIIAERDTLKQRLEAEKLAAATAQDRAKVEYDRRILTLERAVFSLEQKLAARMGQERTAADETAGA